MQDRATIEVNFISEMDKWPEADEGFNEEWASLLYQIEEYLYEAVFGRDRLCSLDFDSKKELAPFIEVVNKFKDSIEERLFRSLLDSLISEGRTVDMLNAFIPAFRYIGLIDTLNGLGMSGVTKNRADGLKVLREVLESCLNLYRYKLQTTWADRKE